MPTNPLVKAILALALCVLILIGVGAGSVAVSRHNQTQHDLVVSAQLQAKVAEATQEAAIHRDRADSLSTQRDALAVQARAAVTQAATAKKKLADLMAVPRPVDLTLDLALTTKQRDAALGALKEEEASHGVTAKERDTAVAEIKELRLETVQLHESLTRQIQLTSNVTDQLAAANKWRLRYRNVSIGFSLVGLGVGVGNYISRR